MRDELSAQQCSRQTVRMIVQDMIQVAPYYLLDGNSSVADILLFDAASTEVAYGTGAQAGFRSNTTKNSALVTLVVNHINLHFVLYKI